MVNSYASDVFFNMEHGFNPDPKNQLREDSFENLTENAEMFISMLTEYNVNPNLIPTVEQLKNDFINRF